MSIVILLLLIRILVFTISFSLIMVPLFNETESVPSLTFQTRRSSSKIASCTKNIWQKTKISSPNIPVPNLTPNMNMIHSGRRARAQTSWYVGRGRRRRYAGLGPSHVSRRRYLTEELAPSSPAQNDLIH